MLQYLSLWELKKAIHCIVTVTSASMILTLKFINRLNFKIPIKEGLLIKLGTLVLQTGKLDLFDE